MKLSFKSEIFTSKRPTYSNFFVEQILIVDNFFLNAHSGNGWCDIVRNSPGKQDNPISFYVAPLTHFVNNVHGS